MQAVPLSPLLRTSAWWGHLISPSSSVPPADPLSGPTRTALPLPHCTDQQSEAPRGSHPPCQALTPGRKSALSRKRPLTPPRPGGGRVGGTTSPALPRAPPSRLPAVAHPLGHFLWCQQRRAARVHGTRGLRTLDTASSRSFLEAPPPTQSLCPSAPPPRCRGRGRPSRGVPDIHMVTRPEPLQMSLQSR